MPVFNTAANIRPLDIVGSYYQGKALRADTELRRQQAASLEKQTDLMDDELAIDQRNAAVNEQNVQLRGAEYQQKVMEGLRKLEKEQQEATADAAAAAQSLIDEGAEPEEYMQAFNGVMASRGYSEIDSFGTEGVVVPPEVFKSIVDGNVDYYRKINEPTADARFIDSLDLPEEEKERLKLAIVKKKGTIVGRTPEDVSVDPRTGSQIGNAHQANLEQYNESSNIQEMIGSVLPRVQELPDTVGATGKIAIGGAGILTTLGYDEMAEAFSKYVANASPEEVSAVMAQLQAVRGQLIPIVTGQESRARLSDMEQQLGDKAVALINEIKGPSDLAKAYPQVVGALRQFYEESWAKQYRLAKQDNAINWPYDLNDRNEVVQLLEEFKQAGLDRDSAARSVTRLRQIQGIK